MSSQVQKSVGHNLVAVSKGTEMHRLLREIDGVEAELFAPREHHGYGSTEDLVIHRGFNYGSDTKSLPVLFTAPHAICQVRDGVEKEQDDFTGAQAFCLANLLDCYALAMGGRQTMDPMKPTPTDPKGDDHPFKQKILECKADGVHFVFDLHGIGGGTAEKLGCDIGIGLGSMPNVASGFLARAFKRIGEELEFRVKVGFKEFAALQRSTVTSFCTAKGLYAVQIEQAPHLRFGGDEAARLKMIMLLATVARLAEMHWEEIEDLNVAAGQSRLPDFGFDPEKFAPGYIDEVEEEKDRQRALRNSYQHEGAGETKVSDAAIFDAAGYEVEQRMVADHDREMSEHPSGGPASPASRPRDQDGAQGV